MPHIGGLDGMRALAVVAVLLYHGEISWMDGGFLGVEVFFVISGFLITALLLAERDRTGDTDVKRFWVRRGRRLLPALFVLLGLVSLFVVVVFPDETTDLKGQIIAALLYITNWFLIFRDQSYFASFGRPPIFQHLWSLAIEEQFYLFWPVVFAVFMRWFNKRVLIFLVIAGIIASTVAMWTLYEPFADPSRVYYGTDTRLAGLLVGVLLAFVWRPWERPAPSRFTLIGTDTFGLAALVAVGVMAWQFTEFDTRLFQGGFLMVSVATAAVIAAVAIPGSSLGYALGVAPMRWLGDRSYSLYLWHWPVFVLTRPGLDVNLDGWQLFAFRCAVSLLLADLSYRFIETPIRKGVFWEQIRGIRWPGLLRPATAVGLFLVAALLVTAVQMPDKSTASPSLESNSEVALGPASTPTAESAPATTATTSTPTTEPEAIATPTTKAEPTEEATPTEAPTAEPPPFLPPPDPSGLPPRVLAIGDSVMLGAVPTMQALFGPPLDVNADISRKWVDAVETARAYKDRGALADVVIIHSGNNGAISSGMFDDMMAQLGQVPRVIFVGIKVPRRWEGIVNEQLRAGAERFENAEMFDWKHYSKDNPDWFTEDGVHLEFVGRDGYAGGLLRFILDGQ
jgi:peptidoglycan/LPS O-acetylase OafA/YrhL